MALYAFLDITYDRASFSCRLLDGTGYSIGSLNTVHISFSSVIQS